MQVMTSSSSATAPVLSEDQVMMEAISRGDIQSVEKMMSLRGDNMDLDPSSWWFKNEGCTALHFAALTGQDEIVELLIRKFDAPLDARVEDP